MPPPSLPPFAELAADPDPPLDLLALAIAAEFRAVDAPAVLERLDDLGGELAAAVGAAPRSPAAELAACRRQLAERHGFLGSHERYDDPENSMLDLVLRRGRGLPILLSIVYIEAARRAGITLAGVGLPGHFVIGHFGADPPLLIDPFNGGAPLESPLGSSPLPRSRPHQIAGRMLNNLLGSYERRGQLGPALRAAELRLRLPAVDAQRELMAAELRALRARLN